jgi:hypothetical protein
VLHGRHRFVDPSGQSSDCEGVSAERIHGLNELGTSAGVIYNTMVLTGPDGLSVPTEKSM